MIIREFLVQDQKNKRGDGLPKMTAFRGGRNPKSGLEPREKHDLGWSEQLGHSNLGKRPKTHSMISESLQMTEEY